MEFIRSDQRYRSLDSSDQYLTSHTRSDVIINQTALPSVASFRSFKSNSFLPQCYSQDIVELNRSGFNIQLQLVDNDEGCGNLNLTNQYSTFNPSYNRRIQYDQICNHPNPNHLNPNINNSEITSVISSTPTNDNPLDYSETNASILNYIPERFPEGYSSNTINHNDLYGQINSPSFDGSSFLDSDLRIKPELEVLVMNASESDDDDYFDRESRKLVVDLDPPVINKPVNSNETLDISNVDFRIPEPKSNLKMMVCDICKGKATGKHYNATTCEGCKGFFRRVVMKGTNYRCTKKNNCNIHHSNRRRSCKACRFAKCIKMGMDKNLCSSRANREKRSVLTNFGRVTNGLSDIYCLTIGKLIKNIAWIGNIYGRGKVQDLSPLRTYFYGLMHDVRCELIAFVSKIPDLDLGVNGIENQDEGIRACAQYLSLLIIGLTFNRANGNVTWPGGFVISENDFARLGLPGREFLEAASHLDSLNLINDDNKMALLIGFWYATQNEIAKRSDAPYFYCIKTLEKNTFDRTLFLNQVLNIFELFNHLSDKFIAKLFWF